MKKKNRTKTKMKATNNLCSCAQENGGSGRGTEKFERKCFVSRFDEQRVYFQALYLRTVKQSSIGNILDQSPPSAPLHRTRSPVWLYVGRPCSPQSAKLQTDGKLNRDEQLQLVRMSMWNVIRLAQNY